jgi:Lipocalin-like domain
MSVIFRLLVLTLLVLTFVLVAIATMTNERVVRAQPRNPLVGTWALVSTIETLADGTTRADPQVGPTPKGYMIYGDAGRMCAQFTKSRATAVEINNDANVRGAAVHDRLHGRVLFEI